MVREFIQLQDHRGRRVSNSLFYPITKPLIMALQNRDVLPNE